MFERGANARVPFAAEAVRQAAEGVTAHDPDFKDPHTMFAEHAEAWRGRVREAARPIRNAERKALDTLGLEAGATAEEIKAQYKTLVKRFHPDANGGSRATEDRFREIVQAYDYLRTAGVC